MRPIVRSQETRYTRDSAFSYTCHACSRCCHDKLIQLNPYEAARLAGNRGLSTTEFLSRYTEANGTVLKRAGNGACVLLSGQGCTVHPDRPLVCRLYPLGRRVTAAGDERFHEVTPHPHTEGEYGTNGTVAEFLARQGAEPFIDAVDRYVQTVGRMSAALNERMGSDAQLKQDVQTVLDAVGRREERGVPDWMDMDAVVARYCATRGLSTPSDVRSKMALHIQAIEEWVQPE